MFKFIEKHLIKTHEHRIIKLAEKLIKELEQEASSEEHGVYNIDIWFDYSHHPTREIFVNIDGKEYKFDTKKPNKNFKK